MKENIELNAMIAEKKGVTIDVVTDGRVGEVDIDRERMKQVLNNLLDNAIRYSPDNDKVAIEISRKGDFVVTKVRDNGPGIPEEELPHVFGEFYQIKGGSSEKRGSAGLGLAITKKIIERHNGRVGVENARGKGTIFFFVLPIHSRVRPTDENNEENPES